MNPLIDVALVLLIFFILTTSYEALRRVMDMPSVTQKKDGAIKKLDADDVKAHFVVVKASMVDGKPQFKVDEQVVEEQFLQTAIEVGVSQGRNQLIIDVDNVTWDTVVKIIDAGQGAKVSGFKMRVK